MDNMLMVGVSKQLVIQMTCSIWGFSIHLTPSTGICFPVFLRGDDL